MSQNVFIPTVIETTGRVERAFDPFSLLLKNRIIFIQGVIDELNANVTVAQLLHLESEDPDAEITIYVNSPGGCVASGLAIIDTMEYIKPKTNTICLGRAASMGAMILMCGTGKRLALKNAEIMIHQPLGGAQGQASDIEIAAQNILKAKKKLYEIIKEKTGKKMEKIIKDCDRNYFMSTEEAKEYGIIDEIMERKNR